MAALFLLSLPTRLPADPGVPQWRLLAVVVALALIAGARLFLLPVRLLSLRQAAFVPVMRNYLPQGQGQRQICQIEDWGRHWRLLALLLMPETGGRLLALEQALSRAGALIALVEVAFATRGPGAFAWPEVRRWAALPLL